MSSLSEVNPLEVRFIYILEFFSNYKFFVWFLLKVPHSAPYLVTCYNIKSMENFLRFSLKAITVIASNFNAFDSSGAHLHPYVCTLFLLFFINV